MNPPFEFDEMNIELSPEIQNALDSVMKELSKTQKEIFLVSTPPSQKGFFFELWNDKK